MKLYFFPGACSLAAHIVLRELGFEFELEKTDIHTKVTESGQDFSAINPKGYVPALELADGKVLTEGPSILQYLADLKPEGALAPAPGSTKFQELREWLFYVAAEIHKGMGPLFNPDLRAEHRQMIKDQVAHRLKHLEEYLAKQAYLLGEHFSIADAYAFAILNWSDMLEVDLKPFPNIVAYKSRIHERPSVRASMAAEGLVAAS